MQKKTRTAWLILKCTIHKSKHTEPYHTCWSIIFCVFEWLMGFLHVTTMVMSNTYTRNEACGWKRSIISILFAFATPAYNYILLPFIQNDNEIKKILWITVSSNYQCVLLFPYLFGGLVRIQSQVKYECVMVRYVSIWN